MSATTNEPRFKHAIEALERVHELADGEGSIVCPRCSGTILYEKRTSETGQQWSKGVCETKGCIAWLV